jgi:hypothetical protein
MAINVNIPSQFREYDTLSAFPATGSAKILYVAKNTNKLYRWDTSAYVEVSASQASSWGSITGTLSNQTDLQSAIDGKVDKVTGKGLSTEDYTTTEKNKLAGIEAGAEVNVNADWNATTGDAQILNKPTIPSTAGLATTSYVDSQDATKQATLVSGTNIKTINGSSVLGSGDLVVSGGGGGGIHAQLNSGSGFVVSNNLTGAGFGSAVQVVNRMILSPFIPAKSFTSSNFLIRVFASVALSSAKILIYSDLNGKPDSLLYQSTDVDCSTTGTKTVTTSFSFTAGEIYWLAFWGNSTPQVFVIATGNMMVIRNQGAIPNPSNAMLVTLAYGSTPTTLTGTTESLVNMPFIGITQA